MGPKLKDGFMLCLMLGIFVVLFVTLLPKSNAQQNSVRFTIKHSQDEPIEIVSITLDGREIRAGSNLQVDGAWAQRITMTVKNISDKPISSIEVWAFTPTAPEAEVPFSIYFTKSRRTQLLQPGDSITLRTGIPHGITNFVQVQVQRVVWEDRNLMWSTGTLERYDPATNTYVPIQPTLARYQLPKAYQGQARMRNVVDDPPFCTHQKTADTSLSCSLWDSCVEPYHSQHCQVPSFNYTYNLLSADVIPQSVPKDCKECDQSLECYITPGTRQRKSANDTAVCQVLGSSPLIIDIRGDGYALTDRAGGVNFDINNTGRAISVSWTAPESDDVFLALDRNGNGTIDDGSELFGSVTPQPNDWGEPNGFKALAVFDKASQGGNENGRIDPRDAVWQRLVLWRDYNHDGLSTDELIIVKSTLLLYIDLDYKFSKKIDAYGNRLRYRAKVQGQTIAPWIYDVYLQTKYD